MATRDDALRSLAERAASCRDCDLWRDATQVVFGEGASDARLLLVGEQPGDQEDRRGHPFVGPAGRVLDRALEAAGVDRVGVYVTNAVKHFKWERAGKVRLHKKPNAAELTACSQWWDAELAVVEPAVVGCLGATAARAVLGRTVKVHEARGAAFEGPSATTAFVTIHPSAVLRDREGRAHLFESLVEDLARMAEWAAR